VSEKKKKAPHAGRRHHHGALGKHMLEFALAIVTGVAEGSMPPVIEGVFHKPPPEPVPVVQTTPTSPPFVLPSPKVLAGATPPMEPTLTPHVITFRNSRGQEFEETVQMPYYKPTEWAARAALVNRAENKPSVKNQLAVAFEIFTPHENDVPLQAYVDRKMLLNSVPDEITLTGEQKNVLKDLVEVKVKPLPQFWIEPPTK
jgi:hypothetical protein